MTLLVALLLLIPASPQVVITRDGKRHIGEVTAEGSIVVVQTLAETVRIPEERVLLVFKVPKDAHDALLGRYEQAKKIYEEASAMPAKDPVRRQRLGVALAICQDARDALEVLCRYYDGEEYGYFLKLMRDVPQFMRLIRDGMGSAMAGPVVGGRSGPAVDLDSKRFEFVPPPPAERNWIHEGDLGTGQHAALAALASEEAKEREQAVRRLVSPPAPHALAALLKHWEKETDEKVLTALVEAAWRLDVEPQFKKGLAFLKTETDPKRRYAGADLCKRLNTKGACEFLAETMQAGAITENRARAMYCSAFRKMRAWSADELRESFAKSKDRAMQAEIAKQLGLIRDPKAGPVLRQAMAGWSASPATKTLWGVSYYALEALGKPGIPELILGLGDRSDDVRRCCRQLLKQLTGEWSEENASQFAKWWQQTRAVVEDEERKFWDEQAAKDYPVDPGAFRIFDRKFQEPRN